MKEFIDNLFFNVFSYTPKEQYADFFIRYTSYLICRVRYGDSSEWTIYPPNHPDYPYINVKNSFEFTAHEFIPFPFYNGTIEVSNTDLEGQIQTYDIKLMINFRNKKDGYAAFEYLCSEVTKYTKKTRTQTYKNTQMFEAIMPDEDNTGISLYFGKDNSMTEKYRITIYPEPYRIHFLR